MKRQKRILTDILSGDKFKNLSNAEVTMLNVKNLLKLCDFDQYDLNGDLRSLIFKDEKTKEIVSSDPNLTSLVYNTKYFQKHKGKNYIVSANLIKALSGVKLDITKEYLPEHLTGYLDFNNKLIDQDGDEVTGAFFHVKQEPDGKGRISMCYITSIGGYAKAHVLLSEEKTLSEVMSEMKIVNNYFTVKEHAKNQNTVYRLIMNIILYAHNHENFSFEPPVKKKPDKKYKYTNMSYTLLDAIHLKINRNLEESVSGHFKWQRHGPRNSLIKLIYVEDYSRNKKSSVVSH